LLFTFTFCGMVHDLVTTIFRGKISFFFSIWFLFMGLAVLITKSIKHNFTEQIWIIRAFINLSIISICLILTIYITNFLLVLVQKTVLLMVSKRHLIHSYGFISYRIQPPREKVHNSFL